MGIITDFFEKITQEPVLLVLAVFLLCALLGLVCVLIIGKRSKSKLLLKRIREVNRETDDTSVKRLIRAVSEFSTFKGQAHYFKPLKEVYNNRISGSPNVDYALKEKLKEMLEKREVYRLVAPHTSSADRSGAEGELEVRRALEWLSEDEYTVFHNIRLPHRTASQEFDSIVVGKNAVFSVETKNYGGATGGHLIVDKDGGWSIKVGNNTRGLENPSLQVKRHHVVLADLLKKHRIPVVDVVVLSNKKTLLEKRCKLPYTLIKVDLLVEFIEEYKSRPVPKSVRNAVIAEIKKNIQN